MTRPSRPVAHRGRGVLLVFACVLIAVSGLAMAWPVVAGVDEWGWLGWPLGGFGFAAGLRWAWEVKNRVVRP